MVIFWQEIFKITIFCGIWQKPWRRKFEMKNLPFLLDVPSWFDDKDWEWRQAIRIRWIVVPRQCWIKVLLRAPFREGTQRFGNLLDLEALLGQMVPCGLNPTLYGQYSRGWHVFVRVGTSLCFTPIASQFDRRLIWSIGSGQPLKNDHLHFYSKMIVNFIILIL